MGNTGGNAFYDINKFFIACVPPGDGFRVHAGGWKADGINEVFGHLIDPKLLCIQAVPWLNENMLTASVWLNGCRDDPLGEVNNSWQEGNIPVGIGIGIPPSVSTFKSGQKFSDDPCGETDPNGAFELLYRIEEIRW